MERATLAAVPPQRMEEVGGWLLGLDGGTVGRAHSAVPLSHGAPAAGAWPAIRSRYEAAGLRAVARVPRLSAFDAFRGEMVDDGWEATQPTLTMAGTAGALAALRNPGGVSIDTSADARWEALFLGDGFDPVDGASRIAILRRARDGLFARVEVEGRVAAVGFGCFSHGWAGVHGMRTAPAFRGRGFAAAILSAFGRKAQEMGVRRTILQVEERNTGAQALYRKAGFSVAWTYEYLRPRPDTIPGSTGFKGLS